MANSEKQPIHTGRSVTVCGGTGERCPRDGPGDGNSGRSPYFAHPRTIPIRIMVSRIEMVNEPRLTGCPLTNIMPVV